MRRSELGTVRGMSTGLIALLLVAAGCRKEEPEPAPEAKSAKETLVIDARATKALEANEMAMSELKGYQAEWVITTERKDGGQPAVEYMFSRIKAEKPNLLRYDAWVAAKAPDLSKRNALPGEASIVFSGDGKRMSAQFGKYYRSRIVDDPGVLRTLFEPWHGFYKKSQSILSEIRHIEDNGGKATVTVAGPENVDGVPCAKVETHEFHPMEGRTLEFRRTYFIGEKDHLVRRSIEEASVDGKPSHRRETKIRNVVLNRSNPASTYIYVPPKGVTAEPVEPPMPTLLANGTKAPDFEATTAVGKKVKLSSLRGKVVLLDFWASWCGPCVASMPHTNEVIAKLQKEGLPVVGLALDDAEPRESFENFVKKEGAGFAGLVFAHIPPEGEVAGSQYRVSGIPTQFIIDAKGVIRNSFVGFNGPTDTLEKALRDVLK